MTGAAGKWLRFALSPSSHAGAGWCRLIWIRLTSLLRSVAARSAAAAGAGPVILPSGVQNAASYEPVTFPNSRLAPGSIFVIKGSGLGPETLVESAGGTQVLVRSIDSDAEVSVPILYSWGWQVAAILPADAGAAKELQEAAGNVLLGQYFSAAELARPAPWTELVFCEFEGRQQFARSAAGCRLLD